MENRLLIVDDELSTRRLLTYLLAPYYKVFCVNHGAEAKAWLDAGNKVDLVITDFEMPIMDGVEFIELLKSESKYSRLPIVVISSQNEEYIKSRLQESKVQVVLNKPIKPKTLFWRIEQILAQTAIL